MVYRTGFLRKNWIWYTLSHLCEKKGQEKSKVLEIFPILYKKEMDLRLSPLLIVIGWFEMDM